MTLNSIFWCTFIRQWKHSLIACAQVRTETSRKFSNGGTDLSGVPLNIVRSMLVGFRWVIDISRVLFFHNRISSKWGNSYNKASWPALKLGVNQVSTIHTNMYYTQQSNSENQVHTCALNCFIHTKAWSLKCSEFPRFNSFKYARFLLRGMSSRDALISIRCNAGTDKSEKEPRIILQRDIYGAHL